MTINLDFEIALLKINKKEEALKKQVEQEELNAKFQETEETIKHQEASKKKKKVIQFLPL